MLPTFKELNSDYNPADVRQRLQAVVAELNKGVGDGTVLPGVASATVNARYKLLIEDLRKRSEHKGIHGFRHELKLSGSGAAEEVLLFVIEQALQLAQLDAGAKEALKHLMGTDPGDPGNEQLKLENNAALAALKAATSGAGKAAVGKLLAEEEAVAPAGEPSAADLMFFSTMTYKYLNQAMWHTMRARRARRLIDAYRSLNKGKMPLRNCSEAAIAAYLLQTYFHHFHKAQVYASPMIALTEFCTHWIADWRTKWMGSGPDDAAALRNLQPVYALVSEGHARHTAWNCTTKAKDGICYGPAGTDAKKATKPLKAMGFTDGSGVFNPAAIDLPWYLELAVATSNVGQKITEAFSSAGDSLAKLGRAIKAGLSAAGSSIEFGATVFYDETLQPLFADESIFAQPDARDKTSSIRETGDLALIKADTKLQFERFSFWVMSGVDSGAREKWLGDDKAMKRTLRQMAAGLHDDEKHAVQPPWKKLFKVTSSSPPAGKGNPIDEARFARMMFDIYGLVEAKDLTKNVSNAWKKFWAPRKDAETAVTLVMLAAGIAISIGTMGAGLPVLAVIGIAAAKTVAKKAAMKGVKKANSKLNSATLKKGDADPNTELKLSSTEAREGAASLARHFVSSFKNLQRMTALREKFVHGSGDGFVFDGCTSAASYAYAANAFDHHFTKTAARLHHLTAMSDAVLQTLEEGDKFFSGRGFADQMAKIHDAVLGDMAWHNVHCNGLAENGSTRVAAARGSRVAVTEAQPSPICYWRHKQNTLSTDSDVIAAYGVSRGLFFGDYVIPTGKSRVQPQTFDMLEKWVAARDVVLKSLRTELKQTVEAEKQKIKVDLPEVTEQDFTAIFDKLAGASKDTA